MVSKQTNQSVLQSKVLEQSPMPQSIHQPSSVKYSIQKHKLEKAHMMDTKSRDVHNTMSREAHSRDRGQKKHTLRYME